MKPGQVKTGRRDASPPKTWRTPTASATKASNIHRPDPLRPALPHEMLTVENFPMMIEHLFRRQASPLSEGRRGQASASVKCGVRERVYPEPSRRALAFIGRGSPPPVLRRVHVARIPGEGRYHRLRNRLSSLFQNAATPSKSTECNIEIDRLIGGRVPTARGTWAAWSDS